MVKESIYNVYTREKNRVLLYNAMSKNYVKFTDSNFALE